MSPDQSGIRSSDAQTIVAPNDDVCVPLESGSSAPVVPEGMIAPGIKGQPGFGRLSAGQSNTKHW
jgi:hypothetical protein